MLTGAPARRDVADVAVAESKRVENLGLFSMQLACSIGKFVGGDGKSVCRLGRIVVAGVVVHGVIPRGAARARADAPIADVELGKNIHSIGNQSAIEVSIAVVGIGIGEQSVGGRLRAPGSAVLEGGVPT